MNGIGSLRERALPTRFAAAHVPLALFLTVFLTGMDQELVRRGWLPVPGIALFASCMASVAVWLTVGRGRLRARLWALAAPFLRRYRTFLSAFLALGGLSLICWFARPDATLRDGLIIPAAFCTCAAAAMLPALPHVRQCPQACFWVAFAVYCLTVWVDVWRPGTFSFRITEAAGLAMNPNTGAYMVSMLAVPLLAHRLPSIAGLSALGLAGLTIFPTLSRGGSLTYLLLCCGYLLVAVARSPGRRLFLCLALGAGAVLLVVAVWVSISFFGFFSTEAARERVDRLTENWFYLRVDISEEDEFKKLSERNDSMRWTRERRAAPAPRTDGEYAYLETPRLIALQNALEAIAASPIWGHGTRFSGRQSILPHNTYFAMWIDFGILGFLCYIALLTAGFRSFYRLRFLPGMFLIGLLALWSMFSGTIFDEFPLFVMLGLLLALPLENGGSDRRQAAAAS